ncbi:hypothetical protein JOL62DRAFT_2182 [Phyllosticta paracitricarpa]|uniref:Uncharacterized protein n=2 Tax=Phyllosticta TaxID=121621 RepID=A0ABR1LJU6_9PEZI
MDQGRASATPVSTWTLDCSLPAAAALSPALSVLPCDALFFRLSRPPERRDSASALTSTRPVFREVCFPDVHGRDGARQQSQRNILTLHIGSETHFNHSSSTPTPVSSQPVTRHTPPYLPPYNPSAPRTPSLLFYMQPSTKQHTAPKRHHTRPPCSTFCSNLVAQRPFPPSSCSAFALPAPRLTGTCDSSLKDG